MLAYRITYDEDEIKQYDNGQVYYDNKTIFKSSYKNGLYEINTFPKDNLIHKHFYYFPQDAYEIAQILLNYPKPHNIDQIAVLEYELNNNTIIDKIGFGNYNCLKRKDYLPKTKLIHISPYENSTYPVLEIRLNKGMNINVTNNKYLLKKESSINKLNREDKLKQFMLYKVYLEYFLNDLNINYPHGPDGLMRISKINNNVKKIVLPDKYFKYIC